jgi:hypothetical protein
MSAVRIASSHVSTEKRKLETITAMAIINPTLATMPDSATAA